MYVQGNTSHWSHVTFPLLPGNPGFQGNSSGVSLSTLYPNNSRAFENISARQEDGNALFSPTGSFANDTFETSNGHQRRTPASLDSRFGYFNPVAEEVPLTPTMDGQGTIVPSTVSEASFSLDMTPYGWEMPHPDSPQPTNEPWTGISMFVSSSGPIEGSDLKSQPSEYVPIELTADFPHTHLLDRNTRKIGSQGIARQDSNHSVLSSEPEHYDEFHMAHPNMDMDNMARDHPLYHNAAPGPDGLYHCPWEGEPTCQHKGEKLKCNYEYEDPFSEDLRGTNG